MRNTKTVSTTFWIILAFLCGTYLENQYGIYDAYLSKKRHSKTTLVTCPPAEAVIQHIHTTEPWIENDQSWSFTYMGWQPPEKISFSQAFYMKTSDSMRCDYKWPSPENPGTYLWLSVGLNTSAKQTITPKGTHWLEKDTVTICASGLPDTCAFELITR